MVIVLKLDYNSQLSEAVEEVSYYKQTIGQYFENLD